MDIETKRIGNIIVVYFKGRLDLTLNSSIELDLKQIISKEKNTHLLLNFRDVSYINSSGIRLLITLRVELDKSDFKMMMCEVNSTVRDTLEIVELTNIIEIYKTEDEALLEYR